MIKDLVMTGGIQSSFLSCDKDAETILKKLFVECQPHSDILKKLLVINAPDCLTNTDSKVYRETIKKMSVSKLRQDGYIKLSPKIRMFEHEEIKAYIVLSFDSFTENETNPFFRDCTVRFDIVCHPDYWEMDNYQVRPLKIAGYIDGILNNARLSGIGTLEFIGASEFSFDENFGGYTLSYRAVHGTDDIIPVEEE